MYIEAYVRVIYRYKLFCPSRMSLYANGCTILGPKKYCYILDFLGLQSFPTAFKMISVGQRFLKFV